MEDIIILTKLRDVLGHKNNIELSFEATDNKSLTKDQVHQFLLGDCDSFNDTKFMMKQTREFIEIIEGALNIFETKTGNVKIELLMPFFSASSSMKLYEEAKISVYKTLRKSGFSKKWTSKIITDSISDTKLNDNNKKDFFKQQIKSESWTIAKSRPQTPSNSLNYQNAAKLHKLKFDKINKIRAIRASSKDNISKVNEQLPQNDFQTKSNIPVDEISYLHDRDDSVIQNNEACQLHLDDIKVEHEENKTNVLLSPRRKNLFNTDNMDISVSNATPSDINNKGKESSRNLGLDSKEETKKNIILADNLLDKCIDNVKYFIS